MQRADYQTLRKMGFADDELKELGLWDVPTGDPSELAIAYIRRSQKSDDLTTLRQHLRDIVRAAVREGKKIAHVYFEQRSASKAHILREEFESATGDILKGRAKTLHVWKSDRLSRRGMGQVGLLLDKFDQRQARAVSVTEGLDSSQGSRIVWAILSERARDESRDIALRSKTGLDAHRAEGKWMGGIVPFGLMYDPETGRLVRHPREFLPARRIAIGLIKNHTPQHIAYAMNLRGYVTRTGKAWSATGIISLAHSLTWAGIVVVRERMRDEFGAPLDKWHRGGTALLDADGFPVSCGEGVISYAEHQIIEKNLASRARPGTSIGDRTRGKRKAKCVANTVLRCPYCKGRMSNAGVSFYCEKRKNEGEASCKGSSINRQETEAAVAQMWQNRILGLSPDSDVITHIAHEWLKYNDPDKDEQRAKTSAALTDAKARKEKLEDAYFVAGTLAEDRYTELSAKLTAQISVFQRDLAELSREADLSPLMAPESLAQLWASQDAEGQRALLRAAVVSIDFVHVEGRGQRGAPVAERLRVTWKGEERPDAAKATTTALEHVELTRTRRKAAETALRAAA
ncbi:recombinase family protein [Streptomyces sp. NRRL S-350]|uniref:recombinase family protein n=1 Tax=Streptomyces sp. NRRL S-350 TaxID=1463902 RepID=UPI0004C09310|nr:recombinase family protein [Streptomyces sp. NRRL S-350]